MAKWDNPDVSAWKRQYPARLGVLTIRLIERLIHASYVKPEIREEYREYLVSVHRGNPNPNMDKTC